MRHNWPVRIAGVQGAIGGDGQIVGLVHPSLMDPLNNSPCGWVDPVNFVSGVVGDIHPTRTIEADAIAGTSLGQCDEALRPTVGCHPSNVPRITESHTE
jgi:hypothetical protein